MTSVISYRWLVAERGIVIKSLLLMISCQSRDIGNTCIGGKFWIELYLAE